MPPAPQARAEVAAAVVDRGIAVVGGFLPGGASSPRVDLLDPASGRWGRLPKLPLGLNHAMAAGSGDTLYVVGGYGGAIGSGGISDRAFALDLGSDAPRWRELPRLPEGRAAGGAAFVAGRLLVVGGVRPGDPRLAATGYAYHPKARRWSALPAIPTPREHLAVSGYRGQLYALAGRTAGIGTNLTAAERYDPATRSWTKLPDVPHAHGGCAGAAGAGLVVVLGGEATDGTIRSVDAYDVAAGRWRTLAPLRLARHGLGGAIVDGRLYALLGGPTPGLSTSRSVQRLALS